MTEIVFQLLIWLASGFAFACGVNLGVFLTVQVTKRGDRSTQAAEIANESLKERNKIGEQQADALRRIAFALENSPPEEGR